LDLLPLVAIKWQRLLFIIFGNRRLYSLKKCARLRVWHDPVKFRMIVHDFPKCQAITDDLVAAAFRIKAIDATTTKNGGLSVEPISFTSVRTLQAPARCYIKQGTYFKDSSGRLIPVAEINLRSTVVGASGQALRVAAVKWIEKEIHQLVELRAGAAHLVVTASHRVMVRRGHKHVPAPAGSLRVGDDVICNLGMETLYFKDSRDEKVDVVEIVFDPDHDVETFFLPEAFLTRGRKQQFTRRSQRSNGAPEHGVFYDTDDGF